MTASRWLSRPGHGITVPEVFRAFMGDRELAHKVLSGRVLPDKDHEKLAKKLARQER